MPFIRHTRDKRGYETTYVMHAYRPQAGPQQTRVLYLFRTPSYVTCGRRALDDEAREALEHTHPDVSFDWVALGRESLSVARPVPPRDRERRPRRAPAAAPPRRVPVVLQDESLLGRVLGPEAAARLRTRHTEGLERIARRARTPEERDRLTERAQRLTPDDWADEAAIRTAAAGVDAEWEALLAELPARRRGRRGGRRRESEGAPSTDGVDSAPSSAIIEDRGGSHDAGADTDRTIDADSDSAAAGDDGDDGRDGAGPGDVQGDD